MHLIKFSTAETCLVAGLIIVAVAIGAVQP